ncbi:MAG: glycosyltransferase [Firmicutes bacterium]|nr:glycosyltransferase [Bacillota bacterium]
MDTIYGKDYYEKQCGEIPYDRNQPQWMQFFGNVAQQITARFRPRSVLDVGCAMGFLVEALRDRGVEAEGIDISEYAISRVREDIRPYCRVQSILEPLNRDYDLIVCIEVLEHLTPAEGTQAIANMCAHAPVVIISSTPCDLFESTHINVRPREYWVREFSLQGFYHDVDSDVSFISPWALVFRRNTCPPKKLNVLAYFTGEPWNACPAIRIVSPLKYLMQEGGLQFLRGLRPSPTGLKLHVDSIAQADVLVIQREVPMIRGAVDCILARAREMNKPVIYELDDLLIDLPPWHALKGVYDGGRGSIIELIEQADAVCVSTEPLRRALADYNPRVFVLPNFLDEEIWFPDAGSPGDSGGSGPVILGYCGTPGHEADLAMVAPAIRRILKRHAGKVVFRSYGVAVPSLRNLDFVEVFEGVTADYRQFARQLRRSNIHIGLAPLIDHPFNRCKSHIKFLEYAACRIAGVYSNLEAYANTVKHGETGLLVGNDPEEWEESIETLISDTALRRHIAANAFDEVRKSWTLRTGARQWLEMYTRVRRLQVSPDVGRTYAAAVPVTPGATSSQASREPVLSTPICSIVIPIHNNWTYTQACLSALGPYLRQSDKYEIIVVDNGSTDGSADRIEREFPSVNVVVNPSNMSFSCACNRGAGEATGKYLVFLNNNTQVLPGWLEELVSAADADASIGIVGSKLLFPDGTLQHAGVDLCYAAPYPITPSHMKYRQQDKEEGALQEVWAVTGASMLIRRDLFFNVGGFEEAYRNGYEDVDLCLKVRNQGYKVIYNPKSKAIHHEAKTPGRHALEADNLNVLHRRWMNLICDIRTPVPCMNETNPKRAPVSVVIVMYNSLSTIGPCLESVLATVGKDDEVIIVDNHSNDPSLEYVKTLKSMLPDSRINIISLRENLGYAAAANIGIREAENQFICMLNPDTVVFPGWLDGLIRPLLEDATIAATGPVSNFAAGLQNLHHYIGQIGENCNGMQVATFMKERYARQVLDTKLLIGFCLMVRRSVLEESGLFDEDLFLGNEDLEISHRLREAGYRLAVVPEVFVYHKGQVSFRSEPEVRTRYLVQQSTNQLYGKLRAYYNGTPPSGRELWGIDWFRPTQGLTSIIIVCDDELEHVVKCVKNVFRHTQEEIEVILCDLGKESSVTDYVNVVATSHPNVTVVRATSGSYAGAVNNAIRVAKGDYIVLMDGDVVVTHAWLARLLACISVANDGAIVSAVNSYREDSPEGLPSSEEEHDDPTLNERAHHRRHAGLVSPEQLLTTFCTVISRRLLDKIGGFDVRFQSRAVLESDFALRAMMVGYNVLAARDVLVHRSSSTRFGKLQVEKPTPNDHLLFRQKWGIDLNVDYQKGQQILTKSFESRDLYAPLVSEWTTEALLVEAVRLFHLSHISQSHAVLMQALQLDETNTDVWHNMAIVAMAQGDFETALKWLDRFDPADLDPERMNLKGICLFRTGRPEEAAQCFEAALRDNPDQPDVQENLKTVLEALHAMGLQPEGQSAAK